MLSKVIGRGGGSGLPWIKGWMCVLCAACSFVGSGAHADTMAPSDPITIIIPDVTSDPRNAQTVSIELDGYDVSAFAQLNGTQITLQLAAPLDTGPHDIVVLVFYENGDIDTVVQQQVTVQDENGAGNWSHAVSLNNTYRSLSHEKSDFAGQPHYNSNGAVSINGVAEKGQWQLITELETLYDNNDANNGSGEEFDLSRYVLEAAYQGSDHRIHVRAGDDSIDQESLLFSAYQRRGISGGIASHDGAYSTKIFGFQSDPTSSPDDNLSYPNHSEERSLGFLTTYAPFANRQALKLSLGYVDGEGTSGGVGFQSQDGNTVYGGKSWNLIAESRLMGGALALRGEYAASRFDSDGVDLGAGEESDNAWNVSAEYSATTDGSGLFDQWALGAQLQEVGAEYWSIANLGLAGDLATRKVYFQGNKGGLGVASELIHQTNNVDDDSTQADQATNFFNIDVYYSPMNVDLETGLWATLGSPSFNFYSHFTQRKQDNDDVLISGYDMDDLTSEYSISANFSKELWSWSLQHDQTWFNDRSDVVVENGFTIYEPPSDTVNYLTSLQVSYFPSERFNITPMLQWNILDERDTNNEYDTVYLGLDTRMQIIPRKWLFSLNYSFNQNDNEYSDGLSVNTRQRDQVLSLESTWKVIPAKGLRAGLDVYLKGSYSRQQQIFLKQGEEVNQVLLGFTLYWNKQGGQ